MAPTMAGVLHDVDWSTDRKPADLPTLHRLLFGNDFTLAKPQKDRQMAKGTWG